MFVSFFSIIVIFAKRRCTATSRRRIMELDFYGILGTLYWIYLLVAILVMVRVVLNNGDTIKTFAWMLVLIFLPFVGIVLYFFLGRDTRRMRIISSRQLTQLQKKQFEGRHEKLHGLQPEYLSLVTFFRNAASSNLLGASEVQVITSTNEFASLLLNEIDAARESIHVQFYIFENDGFGSQLCEHLMAKARQGVEVRVIYDSVGCFKVGKAFFETMRCAGIYVESFLKVRFPLLTNKVNYRNHRKLVVIDGKVGFVGGCNVADRYLSGVEWGTWRDTMLLLRGNAVHGLQASFLIDWYFANRTLVGGERYFPSMPPADAALVQVVQSNPVGEVRTIMTGMIKVLSAARSYVYLQTPYFMPDASFLQALKSAAQSGVDVRLMLPERSDNILTNFASRSYFVDLMRSGIKIYLYKEGFLHCKTFVCDDYLSSVGSVNLDFRSFYYNFEIAAFVYGKDTAHSLKEAFIEDIKCCRQLTLNGFMAERSFKERCAESVARLFSPLL